MFTDIVRCEELDQESTESSSNSAERVYTDHYNVGVVRLTEYLGKQVPGGRRILVFLGRYLCST